MKHLKSFALAFLFSFLSFSTAQGQSLLKSTNATEYTYIYKLDDESALEIYKSQHVYDSAKYYTHLVDSFLNVKPGKYKERLSAGQYLLCKAIGRNIYVSMLELSNVIVKTNGLNNKTNIYIYDLKGNPVFTKVKIYTKKDKEIPYDSDLKCWVLELNKKSTQDFYLKYDSVLTYHRVTRQVFTPQKNKSKNKARTSLLPGYFVLNQPSFKKQDSLMFKAFLLKKNGRPYNKTITLKIYDQRAQKFALEKKLEPLSKGAYAYRMQIPDSFHLDSYYQVYLMNKKGAVLKRKNFKVENYQTKNASYQARLEKTYFYNGEDIYLHLSCFDANNLPLADTKIDINLSISKLSNFYDDSMFIPYTWHTSYWTKQMLSDPTGNTEVLLPDSLFLNANMRFNARIQFINADGEAEVKNLRFHYDPKNERYLFYQKEDSIKAIFLENSKVKAKKARIVSYYDKVLEDKTVTLPYTFHVQEFPKYYSLFTDSILMATVRPKPANANLVKFNGYRNYDSLVLNLENNAGVYIQYWIYQKDELLQKGNTVSYSFEQKLKGGKSIDIIYSYRLAGEKYTFTQSFHHKEKSLKVESDMPRKIYPGQEVVVKLKVKNHKGKNKKNANLAAYAINAKVEGIESPDMPYFGKLKTNAYTTFPSVITPVPISRNSIIDTNYIEWLELRKTAYYNFTYSKEGYILHYDNIESESTEFAPYIIKNGRFIRISEIYIDQELKYFSKSLLKAPYSLRVDTGIHKVVLRTAYEFITIKDVHFKKGFKLFLGIEQDSVYKFNNIEYAKSDNKYLKPEKEQIKKNLLVFTNYRRKPFYIVQGDQIFRSRNYSRSRYRKGTFTVGPLKAGKIQVISTELDTLEFYFQPGYLYRFTDTLISNNRSFNPNLSNHLLNYLAKSYMPFQGAARADTITKPKEIKKIRPKRKLNPYIRNYDRASKLIKHGALWVKVESNRRIIRTWLINQNDSTNSKFYSAEVKNFGRLAAGTYLLVYLSKDSSLYTQNIYTLAGGTNYRSYKDTMFQSYDSAFLKKIERLVINLNTPKARVFDIPPKVIMNYTTSSYKNKLNKTMYTGNILDANFNPVNNAIVLLEKEGVYARGAFTNEAGCFFFSDSLEGEYQIKIHVLNLSYHYYNVKIEKGMTNNADIILPDVLTRTYFNGYHGNTVYAEDQADYISSESIDMAAPNYTNLEAVAINAKQLNQISYVKGRIPAIFGDIKGGLVNVKEKKIVALDGAVVEVNQNGEKQRFDELKTNSKANKIRSEFRDYGFFVPNILTNRQGEAYFTVQFPDNQTLWKTFFPAVDYHKNTGLLELDVQAYKPLSATIAVPSFLIQGDVCTINGKISNYMGEPIDLKPWYQIASDSLTLNSTAPKHFEVFSRDITFAELGNKDITFGFVTNDGYLDAEQRKIPVLLNGIEVSTSEHFYAKNNFQVSYKANDQLLHRTVFVSNNQLDVLMEEINYLKNYTYGCNEQNASKIRALLAEKSIKKALDLPFENEKMLKTIISKLSKTQNKDGSWGWWNKGDQAEIWMSIYITDALNLANQAGYTSHSINKALDFLEASLKGMNISDRLYAIDILCDFKSPANYKSYVLKAQKLNLSTKDKFSLISILQKSKLPYSIEEIIQSSNTDKYGVYWGENIMNFKVNIVQTSSLAYNILRAESGNHTVMLEQTRNYFLSHLSKNRNTIERAVLLQNITDDIIASNNIESEIRSELKINGKVMPQVYPIFLDFDNTEGIYIEKTGAPLQISVYETSIQNPDERVDTLFAISSVFRKGQDTIKGVKLGEKFQHYGKMVVKKTAEFAMLEIPIPAGAVFTNKFKSKLPHEIERQYHKDKLVIFFRNLPYGTYYFNIDLMSRYAGKFNVIPSKISLMYFPDVFSFSNSMVFNIRK
jgi:hypothetical protein